VMVANWDYTQFDPLRTSGEYQNSYNAAASAYNNWRPQAVLGGGPAKPESMFANGTFPDYDIMARAGLLSGPMEYMGENTPRPPAPNDAAYSDNLRRLQFGQQLQQGNYNKVMGGGFAGGVLPENMMQTYQSGGQFGADSRGIRPTNPFAQSPSYGPEQAMSASYGRQGGLGGLGGFGTTEVFNV
jgi:hypothetical protein